MLIYPVTCCLEGGSIHWGVERAQQRSGVTLYNVNHIFKKLLGVKEISFVGTQTLACGFMS